MQAHGFEFSIGKRHRFDVGSLEQAAPELPQVHPMPPLFFAYDHKGVAMDARQLGDHLQRRFTQMDRLDFQFAAGAGRLVILQAEDGLCQFYLRPAQGKDFAKPGAGENEQTDGCQSEGIFASFSCRQSRA